MQLTHIQRLEGTITLKTGLHIGAGDTEMRIGGTDNPVVKNPLDNRPYIPGSSLKGKVRSLLEWHMGLVNISGGKPFSFQHLDKAAGARDEAENLLRLFGGAPGGEVDEHVKKIGPTRLSFWDCRLNDAWLTEIQKRNLPATEAKSENSINRISGVAENPRFTERVIAGAAFDFRLSLKVLDDKDLADSLLDMLLLGLRLLELDSLGGSGSRGYGKVAFARLTLDGTDVQARYDAIVPFKAAA